MISGLFALMMRVVRGVVLERLSSRIGRLRSVAAVRAGFLNREAIEGDEVHQLVPQPPVSEPRNWDAVSGTARDRYVTAHPFPDRSLHWKRS